MLMSKANIIKKAQSMVGTKARDANHQKIISEYNDMVKIPRGYKMKLSDNWCACFVTWLFIKSRAVNIFYPECGAYKMYEGAKRCGYKILAGDKKPKKGDIIFFDWKQNHAWINHVGIVATIEDKYINTIEGNMSNKVGTRKIAIGDKRIYGFARPNYETKIKKEGE